MKLNKNFKNLKENYLFAEVSRRVEAYSSAFPNSDIISLGIGDVTIPLSLKAVDACKDAAIGLSTKSGFRGYGPYDGYAFLKNAVVDYYKMRGVEIHADEVFVTDGAKNGIGNFLDLFDSDNTVMIPDPVYPAYVDANILAGNKIVYVNATEENSFLAMPPKKGKADIIYLCSPNNPTGAVYTRSELNALAAVIEKHEIFVVSDEIYEKLTYERRHHSIAAYSDILKERTIVINGLSKTYSMTGWRIGYAAADEHIASAMSSMQSHSTSNANTIAQYASTVALSDKYHGDAFLEDMRATFDARRALMMLRLQRLGIKYIEPKGAFYVMASVKEFEGKSIEGQRIRSAYDFASLLLEQVQVAVIPCEGFGAPDYIRLSYAASEKDIERGLDAIASFLAQLID